MFVPSGLALSTVTPAPRRPSTLGATAPLHLQLATFVLLTSLIHDVNLVRGLVGEPEEVLSDGVVRLLLQCFAEDLFGANVVAGFGQIDAECDERLGIGGSPDEFLQQCLGVE